MRRLMAALALVAPLLASAAPVAAHVVPGPEFGAHVSEMAPEHAVAHGSMFGDCIATMATTSTCPHGE